MVIPNQLVHKVLKVLKDSQVFRVQQEQQVPKGLLDQQVLAVPRVHKELLEHKER